MFLSYVFIAFWQFVFNGKILCIGEVKGKIMGQMVVCSKVWEVYG